MRCYRYVFFGGFRRIELVGIKVERLGGDAPRHRDHATSLKDRPVGRRDRQGDPLQRRTVLSGNGAARLAERRRHRGRAGVSADQQVGRGGRSARSPTPPGRSRQRRQPGRQAGHSQFILVRNGGMQARTAECRFSWATQDRRVLISLVEPVFAVFERHIQTPWIAKRVGFC